MTRVLRSPWLFAIALVAVLCVTLVVGHAGSANAQRIAHLESVVRCPSCDDLSVGESNASTATEVRNEIVILVNAGKSDTSILTTLESQYGPTIQLVPSGSGLDNVLWIAPVVIFVAGLVIYGRLVRSRP